MIGHRISIRQTRALRARIAAGHGTAIELGGGHFHTFPTPGQLLAAASLEGINPAKTERLRAIARAAQEGRLRPRPAARCPRTPRSRSCGPYPGSARVFAQGILYRGAGSVNAVTDDEITRFAVTKGLRA